MSGALRWADTTTDEEDDYERGQPIEEGAEVMTPKQVRFFTFCSARVCVCGFFENGL